MAVAEPVAPSKSFAEHLEQDAGPLEAAAAGPSQKVELFAKGASIGWLGENSGEWCIVTSEDAAVSLEPYVSKDVLYYKQTGTERYLSVSDGDHYVGFYNWTWGARGWTLKDGVLTSLYSNASLSYWSTDNGYVYANNGNGYTALTVEFH